MLVSEDKQPIHALHVAEAGLQVAWSPACIMRHTCTDPCRGRSAGCMVTCVHHAAYMYRPIGPYAICNITHDKQPITRGDGGGGRVKRPLLQYYAADAAVNTALAALEPGPSGAVKEEHLPRKINMGTLRGSRSHNAKVASRARPICADHFGHRDISHALALL